MEAKLQENIRYQNGGVLKKVLGIWHKCKYICLTVTFLNTKEELLGFLFEPFLRYVED